MKNQTIENIIITTEEGEFDFQANGFNPEVIKLTESRIYYLHPVSKTTYSAPYEIHGGAALINTF